MLFGCVRINIWDFCTRSELFRRKRGAATTSTEVSATFRPKNTFRKRLHRFNLHKAKMSLKRDLELLLKYPMILTKNLSSTEYYGYVKVDEIDYRVDFTVGDGKYDLKPNEDLKPLADHVRQISQKPYGSPVEFLDKLTSVLRSNARTLKPTDHTEMYRKVLREYSELRHFYINIDRSRLSRDLRTVEIVHCDGRHRKHAVAVAVDYGDRDEPFRIAGCDLPEHQRRLVAKPAGSLLALYENFLAVVGSPPLQALFDVLDEIDRGCWVLDPEKPARRDVHRRIMLDDQVSIVITFDSKDFRDMPQIKFLGPLGATKKYAELLSKNYANYDPNGDIILELHNLLEIDAFPRQPPDVLEEELLVGDGECCMCFSKWLNGKLPEVVCNNSSCNKNFHVDCLYKWLVSLKSTKFYYEIYGECPNCEKTIHCPVPSAEV